MKKTIILLSSLCVCMVMNAQEIPDSTDIFHNHLQLNALVVTGLTGDVHLNEVPAPISVIQPVDLQARASTNIISAIAREPGVSQITTGGAISKPVIRGLGYNRVVVVNDGIRQEGQQWGDEHGIEIDGASVHSVEILKGPASLMYGSDAMAGVLIFHPVPVAAPGTVQGSVSTEYQSNNGLVDYSLNASATPAYTLLNMSAGTDIVIKGKKRASIFLIADNLLDTAWQSHLSRLKEVGIYNMGRNVTVKLVIPMVIGPNRHRERTYILSFGRG